MTLVVLAGVLNGLFLLPVKLTRGWRWENAWIVYSLVAMLIVPWIAALVTIPGLATVYRGAATSILIMLACGIGWGIGSLLYGVAARMVGMALTYAIVLGLTSAVGALIPLVALHPEQLRQPPGKAVVAGVVVSMVGIAVCALAGKTANTSGGARSETGGGAFALGLLACVGSGLLSPLINVGFAFGGKVIANAVAQGARPAFAANAVWVVVLTVGCLVNVLYCVLLLNKDGGWSVFRSRQRSGTNWSFAILAGLLWVGAYFCYGAGASQIGAMAAAIGWPIATSVAIIVGNLCAVASGEWKGRGMRASALLLAGVALLVVSVWIIASGNRAA
jgi:L-rhamnose-H+ transport protein